MGITTRKQSTAAHKSWQTCRLEFESLWRLVANDFEHVCNPDTMQSVTAAALVKFDARLRDDGVDAASRAMFVKLIRDAVETMKATYRADAAKAA